jgi:hypothetical protein
VKNDRSDLKAFARMIKLLQMQRLMLIESRSDLSLLAVYSSVIKYLVSLSERQILELTQKSERSPSRDSQSKLPLEQFATISIGEIERMLGDETVPRKVLEAIAVARFHFPKGSLRSLSNLEVLRDRIRTMLENERSHQTIASVARRTKR